MWSPCWARDVRTEADPAATMRAPVPRSAHLPIDDALAPFADMLRLHLPTPEEIEQNAARRHRPPAGRRVGTVAAIAAMAAAAGVLWADPVLQRQTLTTAVGERSTTVLADGSEVRLNTASRVQVAQHLRSRRLALETGEAAFDVAHAPWHALAPWLQRPFTVQAGAVRVDDIGTVFNVRRYIATAEIATAEIATADTGATGTATDAGTDVTVLQGRVRVHALAGDAQPVELGTGQTLRSRPGAALGRPTNADASAPGAATAWRDGWLVLNATPLSAAVAEMQRHRTAPIVLADAQTAALAVSGQFHLDRLDQFIDLLPRLAPVQVERHADGSVRIGAARHQRP
ncbi:MAG: iron dicitrate transport regulator FecR [Comamonadaceae bacterium]|nr:MAG: iron dicitrate transport regulator FecR [Comamonadaceae bacterium]